MNIYIFFEQSIKGRPENQLIERVPIGTNRDTDFSRRLLDGFFYFLAQNASIFYVRSREHVFGMVKNVSKYFKIQRKFNFSKKCSQNLSFPSHFRVNPRMGSREIL